MSLDTQWNAGFNGRTGLQYLVLFQVLDRKTSSTEEWEAMFEDICLLERSALKAMRGIDEDDQPG